MNDDFFLRPKDFSSNPAHRISDPELWGDDQGPTQKAKRKRHRQHKKDLLWWHPHCSYCGKQLKDYSCILDHVIPLSVGGMDTRENLVLSCHNCNAAKNARTPIEWASDILRAQRVVGLTSPLTKIRGALEQDVTESLRLLSDDANYKPIACVERDGNGGKYTLMVPPPPRVSNQQNKLQPQKTDEEIGASSRLDREHARHEIRSLMNQAHSRLSKMKPAQLHILMTTLKDVVAA